jgi:hypothetical protein
MMYGRQALVVCSIINFLNTEKQTVIRFIMISLFGLDVAVLCMRSFSNQKTES